jgi:NAD(P)-dependent dehydrogenase (short-subunit alcohol dehydrogenase family)
MTRHHLTIVTGASRGLGLAIARQLAREGQVVLAIARRRTEALPSAVTQWALDLADAKAAAERLRAWLDVENAARFASATLINNAAALSNPGPLEATPVDQLTQAVRVGLEAPLLLSAAFLDATSSWAVPRKLLMISSGLGRFAMAGSAAYCAVKAGLDHLARAIALDQAARPNGARVVSLAPGVIDTDMQAQLRGADPAQFPERARFVDLQQGGKLDTPEAAAAKAIRFLARSDFGTNPIGDVREA